MTALALGAAQFGLDYGVSNDGGRPSPAELRAILDAAHEGGVRLLDTAPLYGDSESALGAASAADGRFLLATKTPAFGERPDAELLERTFHESLRRLGADRVDALLVHHGWNLLQPGGERLFERMAELKRAGLVGRVGASVYDPEELGALLERYPLELVQAPANVLDQRFAAAGLLERARRRGAAVCLRSAFLQGLLLMRPEQLAGPRAAALARFRTAAASAGVGPMGAALGYAKALGVEHVVIGVNRRQELEQTLAAWRAADPGGLDWPSLACADPDVIDPRRWPARAAA